MELSDFLPFTKDQIQATPLKRHTHTTCVSLICRYMSVSTLSFIAPFLELDTQIALGSDVCTAAFDGAVQETCGLQIPC